MATNYLPRLAIEPQQQPSTSDQLARMLEMKSLINQQQVQQQQIAAGQQEQQLRQQQITDQQAFTKAWLSWDGKDPDTLVKSVLSNGGSGQAASNAEQAMMARQQQKLALSKEQFDQQQKINDRMLGRFDAAESVPDDQLATHVQSAIQDSVSAGDLDPQHAQAAQAMLAQANGDPQLIRSGLDNFKKGYMLDSAISARAKEQADTNQANAKAALDQITAQTKQKFLAMTPDDIGKLVDQVVPPTQANLALNMRTKSMAAFALAHGDQESFNAAIKQAGEQLGSIEKETNPQVQQGKVNVAAAEGAARANIEARMARGSNAAVANVPPHLVQAATSEATKAATDYAQAQSVADRLKAMMAAAKNGNVVSYQLIPQEGALQVTTSQGVHRINMAEIQNYGGGSLWQRMQGHIGKQLTGKSIPDSVLSDMSDMQAIQEKGAQEKYANSLKAINQYYGANFQPLNMNDTTSQGAATAQSVGHKVGDLITQNGRTFKATKVDANGKVIAAEPQ